MDAIDDAIEVFGGERRCCLAREITKIHEEFVRKTLNEVKVEYTGKKPRGEYTFIIEGDSTTVASVADEAIEEALMVEIQRGSSPSSAARVVSANMGVPRKRAYELSLKIK